MKPKVYLETTIISYLTSRPSRDIITAAHQQSTQEWWDSRRDKFDVFVSQIVIQEAGEGDQDAITSRPYSTAWRKRLLRSQIENCRLSCAESRLCVIITLLERE